MSTEGIANCVMSDVRMKLMVGKYSITVLHERGDDEQMGSYNRNKIVGA